MRRGNGTLGALLVARATVEGVLFACIVAVTHIATLGDRPVPIVSVALAVTGVGIVQASVLRDARADRQNTGIAVAVMAAAVAYGVATGPPHAEGVVILARIVAFAIIGEAFVWRNLTVARSLIRWSDARNAGFAAIGAAALAALAPGAIDRSGLLLLGSIAIAATGLGLALARSAEELGSAGRDARGGTSRGTASGTAIILALLSLVGAVVAPYAGDLLGRIGRGLDEVIVELLYSVLLVLGYAAAFVVELFRAIGVAAFLARPAAVQDPGDPDRDAEALRQIEATRPFVVGTIELIIGAIALVVVIILVDRMARERRESLPEGATLDRSSISGDGLGAFFGGLLARRAPRPQPPRDDGTPGGALRSLYWRYLARLDAIGLGWRRPGETPAEHQARALQHAVRFGAAAVLVRAFEDLRYGERDPDPATLAAARRALAAVEEAI